MKKGVALIIIFQLLFISKLYSLTGDQAVSRFRKRMSDIGSMSGTISWNTSRGESFSGSFKFMVPGRIYIEFSKPPGKTIVTNRRVLWVYNPKTNICGVQELARRSSGGIADIVSGYKANFFQGKTTHSIVLANKDKKYSEIELLIDKTFLLKKAVLKTKSGFTLTIALSNIKTGIKLESDMFDFKIPKNAKTVTNPLNEE